jgi:hypothetical protein
MELMESAFVVHRGRMASASLRRSVSPQRPTDSPHPTSVVNFYACKTSDRTCANRCVLCPGYLDIPMRGRFTGATPEGRANVVAEELAERMDKPK